MLFERSYVAGLIVALVLCLGRGAAHAEDTDGLKRQASARFATGVELVGEGNYEAALVEFRRAYDLIPDWRLLYNMAQVLQMMQDYPAAVEHFERYLREGGERVAEARREAVVAEISRLKARVSFLDIVVDQPGAEITVDERVRGTSPIAERLAVSVGRRKVTVRKAGFQTAERYVEVGGGEQASLRFDLEPSGASLGEGNGPDGPQSPAAPDEPRAGVPWALWGITAGLAVGAGVTGVLALSEKSDTEALADGPTTKKKLDDGENRALIFGISSDVLAVGAVAVGVFALYRTLKPKRGEDEARVSGEVGLGHARLRLRF